MHIAVEAINHGVQSMCFCSWVAQRRGSYLSWNCTAPWALSRLAPCWEPLNTCQLWLLLLLLLLLLLPQTSQTA
jgi:hypothetical protein